MIQIDSDRRLESFRQQTSKPTRTVGSQRDQLVGRFETFILLHSSKQCAKSTRSMCKDTAPPILYASCSPAQVSRPSIQTRVAQKNRQLTKFRFTFSLGFVLHAFFTMKSCHILYIYLYLTLSLRFVQSTVFIDWSKQTPQDVTIKEFIVTYSPPVGEPPPNSTFSSTVRKAEINKTVPAVMYTVTVLALLDKFRTVVIFNKTVPSNPEIPLIDAVETGINDAVIFLFPVEDQEHITFQVEYSAISALKDFSKRTGSVKTNDTMITLNELDSDTMYEIRIHSVFNGLTSLAPSKTKFRTKHAVAEKALKVKIDKTILKEAFSGNNETSNDTEVTRMPKNEEPPVTFNYILPERAVTPKEVAFATEGRQLRIHWETPDEMACSDYNVNYTVTSLHIPKSYFLDVHQRTYALIKMFPNHTLQADVWCTKNGSRVGNRPGKADADLRIPEPVDNLRIVELVTDEFFRSRISLAWDWPNDSVEDENFSILLSYFPGKAKAQRKDIEVNFTSPVNITNLKPTELYTFTVVNISRFDIRSRIKGVTQIMPPVISSTLLPGEVTSTTMLITFSQTDVDQAVFDHYLLIACISDAVNVTVTKSKHDKNRQFLLKNLIPGQSYKFVLHTIYKKVESSPVVAYFTTYPLKVKKIRPLVRQSSVKLMWEPEETTIQDIRYKASYTGSDGFESEPIVVEKREYHVFEELKPEIWYTFSVTVLMNDQESESDAQTVVTGRKDDPTPTLIASTPTTLQLAFNKDIFTESNGVVQNYTLIIAEDYRLDKFSYSLPNWENVQDLEVWPPYRTTSYDYNPFANPRETEATYMIGDEKCSEKRPGEVCNGPLKPRTLYYVKLRGCTREEVCMETSYAKVATEKELSKGPTIFYLNAAPTLYKFQFEIILLQSFVSLLLYVFVNIFVIVR